MEQGKEERKRNNLKVWIPMMVIIIGVIGAIAYWYVDYSRYIRTEDAHISSDNVTVSSKILGRITEIYAEEGDTVHKGELLAVLDSSDLQAQKEQVLTTKAQTLALVKQAESKYQYDLESLRVLEVAKAKAEEDLQRADAQIVGGVITQEEYDHTRKAFETEFAQLEVGKSAIKVSQTAIASAKKNVDNVDAQIEVLNTQLKNTVLYAPCNGYIGKRWLLPGDVVQAGQAIYTVIGKDHSWVSIFMEETKVEGLYVGQKVLFTLDAFPNALFYGKIFSLGTNTAATFSLIPANNASGNFTKVTQRIEIKCSIEGTEKGKPLKEYPILSGMSAVIRIVR